METQVTSEADLLRSYREKFLADRAKQEMQIKAWADKLLKVDPFLLKDIELPEVISLQSFIPELYKESPDPEVYNEQYDKMIAVFSQVNAIADSYNQEAKKCLLEYQELNSRQTY